MQGGVCGRPAGRRRKRTDTERPAQSCAWGGSQDSAHVGAIGLALEPLPTGGEVGLQ